MFNILLMTSVITLATSELPATIRNDNTSDMGVARSGPDRPPPRNINPRQPRLKLMESGELKAQWCRWGKPCYEGNSFGCQDGYCWKQCSDLWWCWLSSAKTIMGSYATCTYKTVVRDCGKHVRAMNSCKSTCEELPRLLLSHGT